MPADAPDLRPKTEAASAAPMGTGPDHQIGHQLPAFRGLIQPVGVVPQETQPRTWRERVEAAAMCQPINQMTLNSLRALEDEIRSDAAAHREETREHVEAVSLVCAYKLQIMQAFEDERDEARERAHREGRVRYVD